MTPIFGILGLACRAGQVALGSEMALEEIKRGRAALALIDESASEGTKKKILDACAYRHVEAHILPEGEIARAGGKEGRMAAAVKKGPFSQRMAQLLKEEQGGQSPEGSAPSAHDSNPIVKDL